MPFRLRADMLDVVGLFARMSSEDVNMLFLSLLSESKTKVVKLRSENDRATGVSGYVLTGVPVQPACNGTRGNMKLPESLHTFSSSADIEPDTECDD